MGVHPRKGLSFPQGIAVSVGVYYLIDMPDVFHRALQEESRLSSQTAIETNTEVSIMERALGRKEFETFVMETYHHLVNCERKKMGGFSTLEVFCRMDVGLFLKDDGNLGYFVNEVERGLTTVIWTRGLEVDFNIFAGTMATALIRWADTLP